MRTQASEPDQILRFRKSEIRLHWAIAIPFSICFTTAAVLIAVYNPNPTRPYREVFSWAHRISGVGLIVLPLWTIVRHWRDFRVHLHNMREAWIWTLEDVKWLFLMGPAYMSSRISLPHQGKFNAAEKINFMVLMSSYPVYVVTGVLIWLPGVAFLPWLIHLSMAALATPLLLGHVFMATINPDTRAGLTGMISGFVDRHWAKHHYRRWYDEHFGGVAGVEPPEECPVLACRRADEMDLSTALWARLCERVPRTALSARRDADADVDDVSPIADPLDTDWILTEFESDTAPAMPPAVSQGGTARSASRLAAVRAV